MPPTSTFPLVDAIYSGTLEQRLRDWRDDDLSHESIARQLFVERGITTSMSSVRRWCIDLGIDTVDART